MNLEFHPIDLELHGGLCVAIRAETFVVSFGSDALFWAESGPGGVFYLAALRERMRYLPESCVHAWSNDQILGMLELKPFAADPTVGYINTFYLSPQVRGFGLATILEEYVAKFFAKLGITTVRLTVSPLNTRAVTYYHRQGWKQIGTLPVSSEWLAHYNAGILAEGRPLAPLKTASREPFARYEALASAVNHVLLMEKFYDH